ncbi:hypothetical protein C922_05757 [Plasmodium inui San Antonio 1]|uniref:Uncharacterized protein n=1 Tax=Plasmodium inui San Antonio 1 TaxID=1237626 RepID=W6ZX32_9APIC|nr:hypothetical protein C922_05757 [Plasmodium inui San Antonio 1]EUD63863.1 hypothetical protein C922_05757 [Plasmodium inui San Antonio 1]
MTALKQKGHILKREITLRGTRKDNTNKTNAYLPPPIKKEGSTPKGVRLDSMNQERNRRTLWQTS